MSLEDLTVPELLAQAKQMQERTRLFDTLLNDPASREKTLKLLKEKHPTMPIPELDAKASLETEIAAERDARKKLEEQMRERDIRDRVDRERSRVMKEHSLSDAEMLEVEKLMTDEKAPIPHYDAAVKVFKASQVQATPTPAALSVPKFDMPTKDVWGAGVGNRTKLNDIAMSQAVAAFNEITGRPKAA